MINTKLLNKKPYNIASSPSNVVNLAIVENFNNYGTDLNFYPKHHKLEELKQHIAEYVNYDNILVTNGSGAGLDIILKTFMGSKVLIPIPNYPGFVHSARIYCDVIETDIEHLEDKIPECDIVYVSIPNLPLSYVIDMEPLIKKYDKIFIIDEAYHQYANIPSYTRMIREHPNVIVTRTFSKVFGLAGARVGYICADESLMKYFKVLHSTKDVLDSSIDVCLEAIKHKDIYIKHAKETIERKKRFLKRLDSVITPFSQVYGYIDGPTPWLLLQVRNVKATCRAFRENGYLIRDKSNEIKDAVRISMCSEEHMDKIFKLLCNYTTVIFDLDGTLRVDTASGLYDVNIINNLTQDLKIITDNSSPKADIYDDIKELNISHDDLYCPNLRKDPWYVEDGKLYITKFDCSHELLVQVKKYKKVHVIETNYSEQSSEHGIYPDIEMPHIGYLLDFLKVEVVIVGKSERHIEFDRPALVIGDSINDELFAKNNDYNFYKVTDVPKLHELLKTTRL